MRLFFFGLVAIIFLSACGKKKEADDKALNAQVQTALRTNWANKDVAFALGANKAHACVRLTTLPGPCTHRSEFGNVEQNTCDIEVADAAINVALSCLGALGAPGCHGDDQVIDQVNSKNVLRGDEASITGLGDQIWTIGAGLCDQIFASGL
jgi:hypothetical protein